VRLASGAGRWVLAVAVLGEMMVLLEATVVNVALPTIGRDLGAGVAGLQWTLDATGRGQAARPDHDQLLGGHRIRPGRPRDRPPQALFCALWTEMCMAFAALDALRAAPRPRPTAPALTA